MKTAILSIMERGKYSLKQGNFNEAMRYFQQAIRLDNTVVFAYIGLAQAQQQLGRHESAIANLNQALALKPHSATAYLILGNCLSDMGKLENAIDYYRRALHFNPNYTQAYNNLGIIAKKQNKLDLALKYYHKALSLKPNNADIYNNLGTVFEAKEALDTALEYYQKALSFRPEYAEVYKHIATVFVKQSRLEQALAYFQKALDIKPDYAEAHFDKALVLLSMGRFAQGWQAHTWRATRLAYLETLHLHPAETTIPLFSDDLAGQTIVLKNEQGIGDELFFLRFILMLKQRGAKISYYCHEKIASLLQRQTWIDELKMASDAGTQLENWQLIGDLPLALEINDISQIPPPLPLSILPTRREAMRLRLAALGPPPYLGFTWWAGTKPEQWGTKPLPYREIALPLLADVLRPIQATLVVLQRNPRPDEMETLRDLLGRPVHDFSDCNEDLEDMLVLLDLLDEYLCVHNTNVHLSAGINKTARILIPYPPEWRDMVNGDESPWFKGFKLYRQQIDKDWRTALQTLREDLACRFSY